MIINKSEITAFTNLSEEICLQVLNIIEREFGEIGDFCIEDNEFYFRAYRGYFEDAKTEIVQNGIKLRLSSKSDENFSVGYDIVMEA